MIKQFKAEPVEVRGTCSMKILNWNNDNEVGLRLKIFTIGENFPEADHKSTN